MITSEAVRAARKQAQRARLAKKAEITDDPASLDAYSTFYANQPLQKVKAAKNEEIRVASQNLAAAEEALQLSVVTGNRYEEAKQNLLVAQGTLHVRLEEKRALGSTGAVITGA